MAIVAATLCGCAISNLRTPHATINDVSVIAELDSGYELVAVDGKPVERARHLLLDVVPYAIVKPGNHTLTLETRDGSAKQRTTVSANLKDGKRYRFAIQEGSVVLVEDAE